MTTFLILVGISVAGVLLVFWLLKNEDKPSLRDLVAPVPTATFSAAPPTKKPALSTGFFSKPKKKEVIAGGPLPAAKPLPTPQVKKPSLLTGLFARFKKEKKISSQAEASWPGGAKPVTPQEKKPSLLTGVFAKFKGEKKEAMAESPLPSVTDFIEKSFVVYQDDPRSDPVAPQAALSAAEEKKIEQEIDLAAQIEEWKGKYERLDKIFNEKSAALARAEESLQNELSNRKEFNKLKDMLEKELREAKDKTRGVQVELSAVKTEAEGTEKRVAQFEEKVAKMEKALLGKDDEIADLNRRLKAATGALPVVAAASEPDLPVIVADLPSATTQVAPEVSGQPVEVPQPPAVPEAPPAASSPQTPEPEKNEGGAQQAQATEEGFLKLQPDILFARNPPDAVADPAIQKSEPVEPQGPQDKPISEGKIEQQDEQKKE